MIRASALCCAALAAFVGSGQGHAQTAPGQASAAQAQHAGHALFTGSELRWNPGPASLPPGSEVAILEGNPAQAGPFTLRLKFPDGYQVAPHWHPGIEHITVISGSFGVGVGERAEASGYTQLPPGGFMLMQPKTPHYARASGETVVQLHGVGPWGVTYVNPADDPRTRKP